MKNNKITYINIAVIFQIILSVLGSNLNAQIVIEERSGKTEKLWIEAENGSLTSPMRLFESEAASGGQFMEVNPGNNNIENPPTDGITTFKFNIKSPGVYKIWGRVRIDMDDEDAFWVKMDDSDWVLWQNIEVGCQFHWDEVHDTRNNEEVVYFDLAAGSHVLSFTYGMDQSRLDKLLITSDMEFVPTNIGPHTEARFDTDKDTPVIHETVHFDGSTSLSTEGNIVSYKWDFGDGHQGKGQQINHLFETEGTYQVKLIVSDDRGLTGILTKLITIYTKDPIAGFCYYPDYSEAGFPITFDASNSFDPDGQVVKYKWNFGDGSKATGMKVNHTYSLPGEYQVTLSVKDNNRKKVRLTRLVTVITGVPKKVIFETDMCLDVDDVGALALLHALENNNEAELLAVCYNEVHPFAASAIDAINTWYGRGDIPVGIYKSSLADPDYSPYLEPVSKFPHDLDDSNAPSALEVYREVLSKQPDNSVTIISVGFLNNLSDLLDKYPDLVKQKVVELVIMGGIHNDGFNLSRHNLVSASENVIRSWPSPIVISQSGGNIMTGTRLENAPPENPVREAYLQFFHNNYCGRPSWDEIAVLYGVRGLSDYFSIKSGGSGSLINGYKWSMKPGFRSYIETLQAPEYYTKIIEDMMLKPPVKQMGRKIEKFTNK